MVRDSYGVDGVQEMISPVEGCNDDGSNLICFIGSLASGAEGTIAYSATITENAPDFLVASVNIVSGETDSNPYNNASVAPLKVNVSEVSVETTGAEEEPPQEDEEEPPQEDEEVNTAAAEGDNTEEEQVTPSVTSESNNTQLTEKVDGDTSVSAKLKSSASIAKPGEEVVFTAVITHQKGQAVGGLKVRYFFPTEYFELLSAESGEVSSSGNEVTFTKDSLPSGQEWTITVRARAKAEISGAPKGVHSLFLTSESKAFPNTFTSTSVTLLGKNSPKSAVKQLSKKNEGQKKNLVNQVYGPKILGQSGPAPNLFLILFTSVFGAVVFRFTRKKI